MVEVVLLSEHRRGGLSSMGHLRPLRPKPFNSGRAVRVPRRRYSAICLIIAVKGHAFEEVKSGGGERVGFDSFDSVGFFF